MKCTVSALAPRDRAIGAGRAIGGEPRPEQPSAFARARERRGLGDVGRAEPRLRGRGRREDALGLRVERGERQRRERDADDARGFDEPRLIGLGGKGEHADLALGRACFLERATRKRRDRLTCNAGAAADADGDDRLEACRLMA